MFFEKLFNNKIFKTCIISMFIVIIFFVTCAGATVSAATETMTFNLWNGFLNGLSCGLVTSSGSVSYQDDYLESSNNVSVSSDSITTISNKFNFFNYSVFDYIYSFSLLVPEYEETPVFYISEKFLNQPITFTVSYTLSLTDCRFVSAGNFTPYFTFYMGPYDNRSYVNCEYKNVITDSTDTSYTLKSDLTVIFKETGYIYGFDFGSSSKSSNGVRLDSFTDTPQCFVQYTLSPLVFDVGITAEDIGEAVGEALKEQSENEKQEATQTGDDSVNQVLGGVPDFSSSWTKNFELLADSFAYDGTDFSLTWPEFNIPALNVNGVKMGPYKVWDAYTIDVESVITDVVPSVLLKIAQILFTIALSLFCVIEVMDIVLGVLSSFKVKVKG